MKKEIGSIFPLDHIGFNESSNKTGEIKVDRIYYSLCREALHEIAILNQHSNKIILLPSYTCQTVITPFEEEGWSIVFYPIKKNLRIDIESLINLVKEHNPSLILCHPYFGMDLDPAEEHTLISLKSKDTKIVIDLTQCIFSKKKYEYGDYIVGSYRKWFPIPDGAFLKGAEKMSQLPIKKNTQFVEYMTWAMYLRNAYFINGDKNLKSISIDLSKKAEKIADKNISSHDISDISREILKHEDTKINQEQRLTNYSFLNESIDQRSGITKVCEDMKLITTAPLYFPLYVDKRAELQKELAANSIYAPILWPIEEKNVLVNEEVRYIYDHILVIPCDQRYTEIDMKKVAEIINSFDNE